MELREFISLTILEICRGVADAREAACEEYNNAPIAPAFMDGYVVNYDDSKICFDLLIANSEETTKGLKGKATIKVLGGEYSTDVRESAAKENRVKFTVPFFPKALGKAKKDFT